MKNRYFSIILAAAFAPGAAIAHAHLAKSSPAEGAILAASPPSLVLTFSEPAQITTASIQRNGEPGKTIRPLSADAAVSVTLPLPQLAAGAYTVTWRVVGADHHVVSGALHFTVGTAPSATS